MANHFKYLRTLKRHFMLYNIKHKKRQVFSPSSWTLKLSIYLSLVSVEGPQGLKFENHCSLLKKVIVGIWLMWEDVAAVKGHFAATGSTAEPTLCSHPSCASQVLLRASNQARAGCSGRHVLGRLGLPGSPAWRSRKLPPHLSSPWSDQPRGVMLFWLSSCFLSQAFPQ